MVFRLPAEGAGLRAGSSQTCLGDGCQEEIGWRHFRVGIQGHDWNCPFYRAWIKCFSCHGAFSEVSAKRDFCFLAWLLSRVRLFATPWSVAHQAPLSMRFSRQEYWSGLPLPSPRDLPKSALKPTFPVSFELQIASLPTEPSGKAPFLLLSAMVLSSKIWSH